MTKLGKFLDGFHWPMKPHYNYIQLVYQYDNCMHYSESNAARHSFTVGAYTVLK